VPRIAWFKITDPDAGVPVFPAGADVRVLLPDDDGFAVLADKLADAGAHVRRVRYLREDEVVDRPSAAGEAFDLLWLDAALESDPAMPAGQRVAAATLVPAELVPFLPFPELNQAQAEMLPDVLGHDQNLLVVAPTGAGKTVIGMAAALRAIIQHHRKAAWLVPQRSLTDELDRELAGWRRQGLRVERLSGEYAVDIERIQRADLWVATTEKFEALCRMSALRESLAEVGTLVVDEIHMIGDAERGPVLEALLARIRDSETGTRIVGLSATVSNAAQIAEWLRARLLRTTWRPTRLTWQLPAIPFHADFMAAEASRARLASAITASVARDGGSVLVFCGSKRNVRRTALMIASSRGISVSGVRHDDLDEVQRICRVARIGLHYQGWEHRAEAERAFRQRESDVLVATPTVAAGVNLPARAVIIADTQVGLGPLDVATVHQMFGRAGRAGAGENQGWAFLIVDERERAGWQAKLVAGYTARSRILDSLPEHVLGEAVQQRIATPDDAERWWVQTLAYHQGQRNPGSVRRAVGFLKSAQLLTGTGVGDGGLLPTDLGRITARLMVSPVVCDALRHALSASPVPADPDHAEIVLTDILANTVPKLAQARVPEDGKGALSRLMNSMSVTLPERGPGPGDVARAALLAAARLPGAFRPGVRQVGGVPYAALYQVLEEAPRYLHWIACQGLFGTIHPWCAIVAADLELRITWRMLQPARGAGRLLWACEQLATSAHAAQFVPLLWSAARKRGHESPDWSATGRPANCRLDEAGYLAFLRDRATEVIITEAEGSGANGSDADGVVRAAGPAGSVLAVWAGAAYESVPVKRGSARAVRPASQPVANSGAAVFTWRGDYRATGWLAEYSKSRVRRPPGRKNERWPASMASVAPRLQATATGSASPTRHRRPRPGRVTGHGRGQDYEQRLRRRTTAVKAHGQPPVKLPVWLAQRDLPKVRAPSGARLEAVHKEAIGAERARAERAAAILDALRAAGLAFSGHTSTEEGLNYCRTVAL
jgi:helicase